MAVSHSGNGNDRLDSWKEIAIYLKRSVRTVQRWEREAGMPVHRLPTEKRGVVHAYRPEIDRWWQTRSGSLEAQDEFTTEAIPSRKQLRRRAVAWMVAALFAATVAAFAILYPNQEPRLDNVRRVTWEGNTLTPALSPDGKYMAFASSRLNADANLDLWISSSDGGNLNRLTMTSEHEFDPVFAPDSSRILYSVSQQKPADMMEVAGPPSPQNTSLYESGLSAPARLVAANAGAGRYSPDGKWIALLRRSQRGEGPELGIMPPSGGHIIAIPIGNSEEDRLLSCSIPVWSPDNRLILVSARTLKMLSYGWWLVDVASRSARQTGAVADMMNAGYPQPALAGLAPQAWLPDGTVLTKGFGSGAIGIWAVKLDPKSGRVLRRPAKLLAPLTEARWFSIAGSRVVLNGGEIFGGLNITQFDLDAASPLGSVRIFRKNNPGGYANLSLSSDGRILAFSSRQSLGAAGRAFIVDLDSGQEWMAPLPPDGNDKTPISYTAISPDGKRVAYGIVSAKGRPVYVWNSTSGMTEPVASDCGCRPLAWTPDGMGLLVYRPDSRPQPIGFLDLRTHAVTEILRNSRDGLSNARVSPDGGRIAFTTVPGALFVAPFRHSQITPESEWTAIAAGGRVTGLFWSSDGRRLYLGVADRQGTRILSQRFGSTGEPIGDPAEVHRTDWKAPFGFESGTGIVGAGKRIVTPTATVSTDLWSANLRGIR